MAPTQHIRAYSRSPSPTKIRSYDNSAMSLADAREGHSTAYTGYDAGADISSSTAPTSDSRGFDEIRLGPSSSTSTPSSPAPGSPAQPSLREGLGSRLLANAQPAAAALSRSGSVLHSRAKSWVSYAQKLNAATGASASERSAGERGSTTSDFDQVTALPTPTQEQPRLSAEKPRTQNQGSHRLFGDLFTGESAPVHLGLAAPPAGAPSASREPQEPTEHIMEYRSEFTARPALNRLQRMNTASSTSSITVTEQKPARTSWFSRSSATAKPLTPTRPSFPASSSSAHQPLRSPQPQDELLTMNFSSALFPHGPADPLDPRAFHDLLRSSTALLQKFQTAYGEKSAAVHASTLELDAQREEVEECETRARHLKAQLADVARRAEDAARANAELQAELRESRLEAERVRHVAEKAVAQLAEAGLEVEEEHSTAMITPRRPTSGLPYAHSSLQNFKRASAGSQSQASDSGFESETDSASILSGGGGESTTLYGFHATRSAMAPPPPPPHTSSSIYALRPAKNNGLTGAQTSSAPQQRPGLSRQNSPPNSAAKRLGSEGAAWATVEKLRAENGLARDRVELMQRELAGCIEFVEGLVCGTGAGHG